jgi:ariadne-1
VVWILFLFFLTPFLSILFYTDSVETGTPVKSGIRMMNAEDLRPEMKRRIKDVCEVLGVPASAAGVLLSQHNWSKEALLEDYMGDAEKILKKNGVYCRCSTTMPASKRKQGTMEDDTCPICYDETDKKLAMPCGHSFCLECWHDFCENAIKEGMSCVSTTCPEASCTEVVTEEEVRQAVGDDSPLLSKYLNFQLRSFVESNELTRWCPGAGCDRVACAMSAAVMESEGHVAKCDSCATSFCLMCGEEPHAPVSCKNLALWNEKCRNESETANWIIANTKSCPKCMSRIEKNQGCNHMTCQRCRFEFCWICMGDWKNHGSNTGGYYKCSRYNDGEGGKDDQSESAKAKRELDRYLHFYRRFHAHQEAEKFASKQLKETEQRMVQLQESSDDAKWSDVEFLKTANELLVECRRVLKYTYVFGYYFDTGLTMQRERFEHHQEMLERFTENLSELSEKQISEMDRTDVVNQTRVVERFMKNVLKYVEDGMDET